MKKYYKSKRPRILIKAYHLFLTSANDNELIKAGVPEAELLKMKRFHDSISQGVNYVTACYRYKIDLLVAKRMFNMYYEKQHGQPLSYCIKRPRLKTAFKMLIDGFDDEAMIKAGCNELEIINAKKLLLIAQNGDEMLYSTIAKQIGTTKTTVSDLLQIFRKKQVINEDNKVQISV
jgi:hypothetical protein